MVDGVEVGDFVKIYWWCGGSVEWWLGLWVAMGGWPAIFSFFPLQHMDLCGQWSGGGWFCSDLLVVWGGQWSGGGLGFANLLVVAWICWDVRFEGSNFILLGLNLIFWVLNLLGLCSCSNI